MKNIKIVHYLFAILFIGLIGASCQKDSYRDSGTFAPKYNGTVMQYLKSRPELFDSLNKIIQLAGLESTLDKQGVSFFAPADMSIEKSVWKLNEYLYSRGKDTVTSLEQIPADVWKEYLSKYILNNTYLLKDIPQIDSLNLNIYPGQGYVSIGGDKLQLGVIYNDVVSNGQTVKYAGYRQLFMVQGMSAPVATSDLQTNNGVIHVLNFRQHSFGFISELFAQSVYTRM